MKITRKWLEKRHACEDGKQWYLAHCDPDPIIGVKQLLDGLHFDWANWLLVRLFDQQQNTRYAIYAAHLVLPIYEAEHPDDKRPRQAIAAARKYLREPTEANRDAAPDAGSEVYSVANHTRSYSAAFAAYAASAAADAAASNSGEDAYAAAECAYIAAPDAKTGKKIILYGIRLLREGDR